MFYFFSETSEQSKYATSYKNIKPSVFWTTTAMKMLKIISSFIAQDVSWSSRCLQEKNEGRHLWSVLQDQSAQSLRHVLHVLLLDTLRCIGSNLRLWNFSLSASSVQYPSKNSRRSVSFHWLMCYLMTFLNSITYVVLWTIVTLVLLTTHDKIDVVRGCVRACVE